MDPHLQFVLMKEITKLKADLSAKEQEIVEIKENIANSNNDGVSAEELEKQLKEAKEDLARLEEEIAKANEGKVSETAWQFHYVITDNQKDCFEFANTLKMHLHRKFRV